MQVRDRNLKANPGHATERKRSGDAVRNEVVRAERYEIRTAILYRACGERGWYEGVTENISSSGVLIQTNRSLDQNTAIEMRFVLPVELSGESAAEVFCRGVVVRTSKRNLPTGVVVIASVIAQSRFLRHAERDEE